MTHPTPRLDPARALALAINAMISHVSEVLNPGAARMTLRAYQLLEKIEAAYPGSLTATGDDMTLSLLTIRASADKNPIALLRNWQDAARETLIERGW